MASEKYIQIAIGVLTLATIAFLLLNAYWMSSDKWHYADVEIVSGPNAGRKGKVVSVAWLGNLWHRWLNVNVPATEAETRAQYGAAYGEHIDELIRQGTRHWIDVRVSDVRMLAEKEGLTPPARA